MASIPAADAHPAEEPAWSKASPRPGERFNLLALLVYVTLAVLGFQRCVQDTSESLERHWHTH